MRGWGDYTHDGPLSGNQIIDSEAPMNIATVNDDMTGDVSFAHQEFIGNVFVSASSNNGASPFQLTKYEINPGLARVFPFLSDIARNFTMYELEGCVFQYKPTSGESANASNMLGKIILATHYDSDARDFRSAMEMENYSYANCTKPSLGAVHGVETDPKHRHGKMLYIRSSAEELQRKDAIFCDVGNFYIGTEGVTCPVANTDYPIGELWVSYRVRLSRPRIYGLAETAATTIITWTGGDLNAQFGTTRTVVIDTIGVSLANDGTITFPAGTYGGFYVDYNVQLASTGIVSVGGNPIESNIMSSNPTSHWNEPNGVSATWHAMQRAVRILDPTKKSTWNRNLNALPTMTSGALVITRMNSTTLA